MPDERAGGGGKRALRRRALRRNASHRDGSPLRERGLSARTSTVAAARPARVGARRRMRRRDRRSSRLLLTRDRGRLDEFERDAALLGAVGVEHVKRAVGVDAHYFCWVPHRAALEAHLHAAPNRVRALLLRGRIRV